MSLIIKNALVVEDPIEGTTADLSVLIQGELIEEVGPFDSLIQTAPEAEIVDGSGMLLLPGLIDAHTHLYAALTPGMPYHLDPPRNFPQILERVWWPFDRALAEDDLLISAQVGSLASLRNGITTLVDHHSSPLVVSGSLSRIAAGIEKIGLRSCLAYEVSDRDGGDIFELQIQENIRYADEVRQQNSSLRSSMFGLHAVFSLSDASLRRCAGEARDLDVGCHLHLVEHLTEKEKFAETHDQSIIEFLSELEVLGPKTLAAHTVHVDDADLELLKNTGTFNVHNPQSNMGNGVGIAPIKRMIEYGQPVGLGSDGFYDLAQSLILARLLQTLDTRDPSGFSGSSTIRMAYENNSKFAEGVFQIPFGKVKSGYAADLILIAYDPATPIKAGNIHGHILAALSRGQVKTAVVGGKVLLQDDVILGVDEEKIMQESRIQAEKLWARLEG